MSTNVSPIRPRDQSTNHRHVPLRDSRTSHRKQGIYSPMRQRHRPNHWHCPANVASLGEEVTGSATATWSLRQRPKLQIPIAGSPI